jgi:uncharacterized protein (TIGR03067 family)
MGPSALGAVLIGLLIAADDPEAELGRFQGTWRMVSAERDGRRVPEAEVRDTVLVIRGRTFAFPEDKRFGTGPEGTFTIDPSRRPKEIDATPSSGPEQGQTSRGIYRIEGDRYEVCFAPPGKPRPTRFVSEPGSGSLHSIWKRAKADAP